MKPGFQQRMGAGLYSLLSDPKELVFSGPLHEL